MHSSFSETLVPGYLPTFVHDQQSIPGEFLIGSIAGETLARHVQDYPYLTSSFVTTPLFI
jgi:hypothetical protein